MNPQYVPNMLLAPEYASKVVFMLEIISDSPNHSIRHSDLNKAVLATHEDAGVDFWVTTVDGGRPYAGGMCTVLRALRNADWITLENCNIHKLKNENWHEFIKGMPSDIISQKEVAKIEGVVRAYIDTEFEEYFKRQSFRYDF